MAAPQHGACGPRRAAAMLACRGRAPARRGPARARSLPGHATPRSSYLSRRNSNVRVARPVARAEADVTAECEAQLRALEEALAKHEFTATREWTTCDPSSVRPLGDEPVAHPRLAEQVSRMGGIGFDLLPQLRAPASTGAPAARPRSGPRPPSGSRGGSAPDRGCAPAATAARTPSASAGSRLVAHHAPPVVVDGRVARVEHAGLRGPRPRRRA